MKKKEAEAHNCLPKFPLTLTHRGTLLSVGFAGLQLCAILFETTPLANLLLVGLYLVFVLLLQVSPLLLIWASILVAPSDGIPIFIPNIQNPDVPLHVTLITLGLIHGFSINRFQNLLNPKGSILALSIVFYLSHLLSAESIQSMARVGSNFYSSLPILIGILILATQYLDDLSREKFSSFHIIGTAVVAIQTLAGIIIAATGVNQQEESRFFWRSDSRIEWITANSLEVAQISLILLAIVLLPGALFPRWYQSLSLSILAFGVSASGSTSAYVAFVLFAIAVLWLRILPARDMWKSVPIYVATGFLAVWPVVLLLVRPFGLAGPLARLVPAQNTFEGFLSSQAGKSALYRVTESQKFLEVAPSDGRSWLFGNDVTSVSRADHHNFFFETLGVLGLVGLALSALITLWTVIKYRPKILNNLPFIFLFVVLAAVAPFPSKPWAYFFLGLVTSYLLSRVHSARSLS